MRFCSIMNQLLQFFPRNEFQEDVQQTKAERHARGFASWDQFVAMLYCQVADSQSLREIVGGLANCQGRLASGESLSRRRTPRWLMPIKTDLGNCLRKCFIGLWTDAGAS